MDGIQRGNDYTSIVFPPKKTLTVLSIVNKKTNVYGDESYTGFDYSVVEAKNDSRLPDEIIPISCNSGVITGKDVTITPTCNDETKFIIQNTKKDSSAFTSIVVNINLNGFIIRKSVTLRGGKQIEVGIINKYSEIDSENKTYNFEIHRVAEEREDVF